MLSLFIWENKVFYRNTQMIKMIVELMDMKVFQPFSLLLTNYTSGFSLKWSSETEQQCLWWKKKRKPLDNVHLLKQTRDQMHGSCQYVALSFAYTAMLFKTTNWKKKNCSTNKHSIVGHMITQWQLVWKQTDMCMCVFFHTSDQWIFFIGWTQFWVRAGLTFSKNVCCHWRTMPLCNQVYKTQ